MTYSTLYEYEKAGLVERAGFLFNFFLNANDSHSALPCQRAENNLLKPIQKILPHLKIPENENTSLKNS